MLGTHASTPIRMELLRRCLEQARAVGGVKGSRSELQAERAVELRLGTEPRQTPLQ